MKGGYRDVDEFDNINRRLEKLEGKAFAEMAGEKLKFFINPSLKENLKVVSLPFFLVAFAFGSYHYHTSVKDYVFGTAEERAQEAQAREICRANDTRLWYRRHNETTVTCATDPSERWTYVFRIEDGELIDFIDKGARLRRRRERLQARQRLGRIERAERQLYDEFTERERIRAAIQVERFEDIYVLEGRELE